MILLLDDVERPVELRSAWRFWGSLFLFVVLFCIFSRGLALENIVRISSSGRVWLKSTRSTYFGERSIIGLPYFALSFMEGVLVESLEVFLLFFLVIGRRHLR